MSETARNRGSSRRSSSFSLAKFREAPSSISTFPPSGRQLSVLKYGTTDVFPNHRSDNDQGVTACRVSVEGDRPGVNGWSNLWGFTLVW